MADMRNEIYNIEATAGDMLFKLRAVLTTCPAQEAQALGMLLVSGKLRESEQRAPVERSVDVEVPGAARWVRAAGSQNEGRE